MGWRGSGGPVARAHRRAQDRLRAAGPADGAGILQAMALTEEPEALPAMDPAAAGWTPLWSRGERSVFHTRLVGHHGPVRAVAFTTITGRGVLATGGADHTVRLWDPRTGEPAATLDGHTAPVAALAFGLVGGRPALVSTGTDRTARLWDPVGGAPLGSFTLPEGDVAGVALLTAGGRDRLVVATDHGSRYERHGVIDVWDAATGDPLGRISEHRWSDVRASGGLAVVSGGHDDLLAAFAPDGDAVLLLDPVTGAEVAVLEWESGEPGASFVPPLVVSQHLLGVTAEAELELQEPNTTADVVWWDVRTGEVARSGRLGFNERLLAAGDGRFASVTALTRAVNSRYARTDTDVTVRPRHAVLRGHAGHVHAAAFGSVDGAPVVATAGADGTVLLWDADEDSGTRSAGHGFAVLDGRALVVCTGQTSVDLLDAATGDGTGHLRCQVYPGEPGHRCPDLTREAGWYVSNDHCRRAVAAGPVGGHWLVATCGNTRGVLLWDPVTRDVLRVLDDVTDGPLRFGEAGGRALLVVGGRAPRVWDPATGELVATLRDPRFEMHSSGSVAFGSAGGAPVVAVGGTARGGGAVIDVWDPSAGAHLRRIPVDGPVWRGGPPGTSVTARLAASSGVLACAAGDQVHLRDPGADRPVTVVTGADGLITCVDVTVADGRVLLVAGTDQGIVRLWADGVPGAVLATFARPVRAVAVAVLDGVPQVFAQSVTGRLTACRV